MFIAMNRFQVIKGKEQAFETVWKTRESYLAICRASSSFIW